MTYKTTMGAPLTERESNRIDEAREALREMLAAVLDRALHEPRDLLNEVSDIIGACWTLRAAIEQGWGRANDRAFRAPPSKPGRIVGYGPKEAPKVSLDEFSHEEILEALAVLKGEGK